MEQNEKKVLAELMQLGYERNVIAFADMKNNEELEGHFDEMSTRVIKDSRDWFDTEGRQFISAIKIENLIGKENL